LKRHRLTRGARRDVQRIWAYIAEDSEAAARRLVEEFDEKFEFLGRNPRAGRAREDVAIGLRSFPCGEYLIFYRVMGARVAIVRVVHGRRDLARLLQ
jgi:toxin ParE1/3/4